MAHISCQIVLDQEGISNSALLGAVELSATEEIVVEDGFVEVLGIAKCSWNLRGRLIRFRKRKFSGKQGFFICKHRLMNKLEVVHCNGIRAYAFQCSFSSNLPSTLKTAFGEIKYIGRVTITDIGGNKFVSVQNIIIPPRRDLRIEQHLLHESRVDFGRTFRFAAINLGTTVVSIWLPITGFTAGQSIPVVCTIVNDSEVHFGSIIFVLTAIEKYRSMKPRKATLKIRNDICRVARVADISKGRFGYYTLLETTANLTPTMQFHKCRCFQLVYEVWVSLQGVIPRYKGYHYPNIDTPGIPVIMGTKPLTMWDNEHLTATVMGSILKKRREENETPDIEEILEDEGMDEEI